MLPDGRLNGRWAPGTSGNLAGRPKGNAGLAAYIKDRTRSGVEIAEFVMDVMRGRKRGASMAERFSAAYWLADRAFGKVPQRLAGDEGEPLVFTLQLGRRDDDAG